MPADRGGIGSAPTMDIGARGGRLDFMDIVRLDHPVLVRLGLAVSPRTSKGDGLRTLAASSSVKPAEPGVRRSVPGWRAMPDSDEHYVFAVAL